MHLNFPRARASHAASSSSTITATALALLLSATSYAQTAGSSTSVYSSRWANGTTVFVSPNGTNSFATGWGQTRQTAFRTLQFALNRAQTSQGANTAPIVINVLPGLYMPLGFRMPARGVKLQALGDNVVLSGSTQRTQSVIWVDEPGIEFLPDGGRNPDSIIQGLEIRDGERGVEIRMNAGETPPQQTLRTEIRNCTITENLGLDTSTGTGPGLGGIGIDIVVDPGWDTAYVIEDNIITQNGKPNELEEPSIGVQISVIRGVDSSLVRSNSISEQEAALVFNGSASAETWCRPRVQSNFLFDCEQLVFTRNSGTLLINNTAYRLRPWSSNPDFFALHHEAPPFIGAFGSEIQNCLQAQFGFLVLNCIVDHDPTIDTFTGTGTFVVSHSNLENLPPGPMPTVLQPAGNKNEFGDPIQYVDPVMPDLHLQPTAPQVDSGDVTNILPGQTALLVRKQIPVDVRQDVDGDVRLVDANADLVMEPDRGGDEVHRTRLSTTQGVDGSENVLIGTSATLQIDGPAGWTGFLFAWFDDPARSLDDVIYPNQILPGFGNLLLPDTVTGPMVTVATLPLVGGSATFTLPFGPLVQPESEILFQALVLDLSAPQFGGATNRVRLEAND